MPRTTMNAKSLATKVRQLSLAISLALASLTIVSITTTQSAHADTCSCDQGKLYSIEIDELNNAHPHKLTLTANNAYYQLIDDKGTKVLSFKTSYMTSKPMKMGVLSPNVMATLALLMQLERWF